MSPALYGFLIAYSEKRWRWKSGLRLPVCRPLYTAPCGPNEHREGASHFISFKSNLTRKWTIENQKPWSQFLSHILTKLLWSTEFHPSVFPLLVWFSNSLWSSKSLYNQIKWGAFSWSFGPNPARGSIGTTTIRKTHPTLLRSQSESSIWKLIFAWKFWNLWTASGRFESINLLVTLSPPPDGFGTEPFDWLVYLGRASRSNASTLVVITFISRDRTSSCPIRLS